MSTPTISDELVETFLRAEAQTRLPQANPVAISNYITAARNSPIWEAARAGLEAAFELHKANVADANPAVDDVVCDGIEPS